MFGKIEVREASKEELARCLCTMACVHQISEKTIAGAPVLEAEIQLKNADMGMIRASLDKSFGPGKIVWVN